VNAPPSPSPLETPISSPSMSSKARNQADKLSLMSFFLLFWGVMFLCDRFLPWFSAVMLVLGFMSIYTWLVTLAMIDQKRRHRKNPVQMDMSYQPPVAVIIPAHNEEFVIRDTLLCMLALDYPDVDLVVVDDRSTDGTAKVLADLQEEFPGRFRFWTRDADAFPGKSAVLNEALAKTTAEVLCVFDADATVEPDFLKRIVPFLADEETAAVQARKIIRNGDENWLTRCQNYEQTLDSHFQSGRDTIQAAVELRGNGELIKRKALESVGGWNNQTLTDDLDLSTQLHLAGWDIRFAHKVYVWEEGILDWMPLLRQRRRWAEGSLRRYLEYAGDLMFSPFASMRTKVDMISYFAEFLLPIWVLSDWTMLLVDWLSGDPNKGHMISSFVLLPWLTLFFSSNLVVAILRFHRPGFNKPDITQALLGMTLTGLFMTWVWVPITFWVTLKILFSKERSMDWGKTEHLGSQPSHPTPPITVS
jgi:1,2-diacylglycerol 3-beta-glucosyltransferase